VETLILGEELFPVQTF